MLEKRPRHLTVLLVAAFTLLTAGAGGWILWVGSPGSNPVASRGPSSQVHPASEPNLPPAKELLPAPTTADEPAGDTVPAAGLTTESLRQRLEKPGNVPGEALMTFRSKEELNQFVRRAAALGLDVLGTIPQLNAARIHYSNLEPLRDALASVTPSDVNVEGNPWISVPNQPAPQPAADNQHGAAPFGNNTMDAINAAGDRANWGNNVTVAVVDTGILDHPTFGAGQVTHMDLVNDGQPFDSHGTSVASLIGGQDPQAPGVAPGAQLLDVRVVGADGYTVGSLLAQGIVTATDHGAQVINISLGGYGDSTLLDQSLDYAFQHGVVVVAAAGNDAYNQLAMPAAYPGVISVASVDANGQQAYFSNSGQGLSLAAPGVGVVTAWSTDQLALASGTSQSSALVTGATAAYLGWGVSSSNVANRLKNDARPTGASMDQVGAGILMIHPPAR